MHSVSVAMAQNCQNAVQMLFFFPVLWKLESLPLNAASFRKSFSSCQTLPYQWSMSCAVVQLWTMIGWVITCGVASLPSKTQQEVMEQFLFYLAWQLLSSLTQAWATHQLYFGASRWERKLLSAFFFVRLNLMGHSESLKRPQFLRANYASVDILYCLSVIYLYA